MSRSRRTAGLLPERRAWGRRWRPSAAAARAEAACPCSDMRSSRADGAGSPAAACLLLCRPILLRSGSTGVQNLM